MDAIWSIGGGFVGVAIGGFLGFQTAERFVKGRSWLYWTANVVGAAVGVAVATWGLAEDLSFFWIGGLAFIGTWLTGLKYGYAKNPAVKVIRKGVSDSTRA